MKKVEDELLEIVDEQNRVVGTATRGEAHKRGLMHRSVHIFLHNTDGMIFVQKRSHQKDRFPLHYDSSAAGHLDPGENYQQCAARELEEELGIKGVPLLELAYFKACEETGWEHTTLFFCRTDEQVVINRQEILEGRFHTWQEVSERMEDTPSDFTPVFMMIFRWFVHNKSSFEKLIEKDD